MTKKAQFEIMGIAVLAVILILGMLIFSMLNQNKKEENTVKQYTNTEFSQGYLEVLLRTTAENCKGQTVDELIRDCGKQNPEISCASSGNADSCINARETAQKTLDETLKKYNKKYSFKAMKGQQPLFQPIESPSYSCAEKERPGRQPMPGNIILMLEICG